VVKTTYTIRTPYVVVTSPLNSYVHRYLGFGRPKNTCADWFSTGSD